MFNCILQWSDEMQQVYLGNRTAQLIGSHVGKMAVKIRKELVLYMRNTWTMLHKSEMLFGNVKNEF